METDRPDTPAVTKPDDVRRFGHLFVVRADLTLLDCDALLIPTDDAGVVEAPWRRLTNQVGHPRPWSDDTLIQWATKSTEGTLVAFGRVAIDEQPGLPVRPEIRVERASKVASLFIRQAAERVGSEHTGSPDGSPVDPGRTGAQRRPRIALPLIGTGAGGLGAAPGDLLLPLLHTLRGGAAYTGIDVVLTVIDPVAWGAIQQVRRSDDKKRTAHYNVTSPAEQDDAATDADATPPPRAWWELDDAMLTLSDRLIEHARDEQLVLFIGAGVSRDAGAPDWSGLLDAVAVDLGIDAQQDDQWRRLDPRDRARLLEREAERQNKSPGFRELVLEHLSMERFGLTHALLASLGVEAAVTTNYDTLYEAACYLPGTQTDSNRLAVLPYESVAGGRPWLLKMHGDRDRSHIVITRSDYLRLNRHGGALFGIVQAMLVTRHLLFIGYSLSDEDFHALVDEIESAINPKGDDPRSGPATQPGRPLGTALVLEDVAWTDLWSGTIDIERVGDSTDALENARTLQLVLDRVNAYAAAGSTHVLDRRFDALLDDDERGIVRRLRNLGDQIRSLPEDSSLRTMLSRSLRDLGYVDQNTSAPNDH